MAKLAYFMVLATVLFSVECVAKKTKSSKFKGIVRKKSKSRSKDMKFPDKFGYDPKGKKKG